MKRDFLVQMLDQLLEPQRFRDYGPNGLQVEGCPEVSHVVTGVTASLALIERAVQVGADAVLVHHGLFWRGQDGRVTGWMKRRLALLLQHDINLLAYHLPLDAHPELGNNAQWGAQMGWVGEGRFGEQDLGWLGRRAEASGYANGQALADHLTSVLNRPVSLAEQSPNAIKKIAWCSGGAQSYFEAAIAAGADAFVTGEISEPQAHYARECGVAFLACGHHATERWGVAAVGEWLASQHGLAHTFIDIPNPA
jgi:dinuclear metal center YbgI/SA1388 family protein